MEKIFENTRTFGKLNALICFKAKWSSFHDIEAKIKESFGPGDISYMLLEMPSFEMKEISKPELEPQRKILRCFYEKSNEKIILSYIDNQFVLDHLFWYDEYETISGDSIIKWFFEHEQNAILLLGFELSVKIESLSDSIAEHVNDPSLYPLTVLERKNEKINKNNYIIEDSDLRYELIKKYLNKLNY